MICEKHQIERVMLGAALRCPDCAKEAMQKVRVRTQAAMRKQVDPIRTLVADHGWGKVLRELVSLSHVYVQRQPRRPRWKRLQVSLQQAVAYVELVGEE